MKLNTFLYITLLLNILVSINCQQHKSNDEVKPAVDIVSNNTPAQNVVITESKESDCQEFIELHSASYLANEYGKSEMWVLNNLKINLWQKTSANNKGKKTGELLPGSRARIIEKGREDYKVISPYDKKIGWISKIQISKTLMQNVNTFESCSD
jgi:hypothetical protein